MPDKEGAGGTEPSSFLKRLGSDLAARTEIDAELAEILNTHILSASTQSDCVTNARKAIADLAKARASPQPKGT